jgi:hypothetical protein
MADPPARAATGANGVIVAGDGDIVVDAAGPHLPDYVNQTMEVRLGLAASHKLSGAMGRGRNAR